MIKLIAKLSSRFIFTKHSNRFINFIAAISILGVILGIAALSTTMAVINGFELAIKEKLLTSIPQITVELYTNDKNLISSTEKVITEAPNISVSYPLLQRTILIIAQDKIKPLHLSAIPEKYLALRAEDLGINSISKLGDGIIISNKIAGILHKKVGDQLNIATFSPQEKSFNLKFTQVMISAIFNNSDLITENLALTSLKLAQKINIKNFEPHYALYTTNPLDLFATTNFLEQKIGKDAFITTWQQYFSSYFESLEYTKNILFLMLGIIILVAAFNLLATLIMIVNDKYQNIAILRTLGASRKIIFIIFVTQGLVLTALGSFIGIISGFILTKNINQFTTLIGKFLGYNLVNQSVYILDYLPTRFSWHEAMVIILFTFLLAFCATLYPAWHACNKQPAEIL